MLRTLLGLVVITGACGPGLRAPDGRVEARASLADAAGDAAALQALMHDEVVVGKLWFEDPQCAPFSSGRVHEDRFAALARCLAGLKLRSSTRADALADVTVMSYGPGLEVEARVLTNHGRSQLTWIGFASHYAGSSSAPTLDAVAFEGLRASGERVPALDAATVKAIEADLDDGKGEMALVWLKVCINSAGGVTMVNAYEPTSYVASDAFIAAARTWTFRPFMLGGEPVPACSMVRMAHPADKAPPVEVLPLEPPPSQRKRPPLVMSQRRFRTLLEGKRIAGTTMIVPDDHTKSEIFDAHVSRVQAQYRVCIDEAGHVVRAATTPQRVSGVRPRPRHRDEALGVLAVQGRRPAGPGLRRDQLQLLAALETRALAASKLA